MRADQWDATYKAFFEQCMSYLLAAVNGRRRMTEGASVCEGALVGAVLATTGRVISVVTSVDAARVTDV